MSENREYLQQFLDSEMVEEIIQEVGGEYKDNSVVKFSKEYSLKSGPERVPSYIIYMVYRRLFTTVPNSAKIRPSAFFRTFKKLFTQRRSGNQRFYMLNTDFGLSEEQIESYKTNYKLYYFRGNKVDEKKQN